MKIADFGLARDINNIDYYKKTTNVSRWFSYLWETSVSFKDSLQNCAYKLNGRLVHQPHFSLQTENRDQGHKHFCPFL